MRVFRVLAILTVLVSCASHAQPFPTIWLDFEAEAEEFQPRIGFSGRVNSIAQHPDNPNVVLVTTPTGGMFRSSNGGQSWSHIDTLPPMYMLDVVIHPDAPNVAIATARRDFRHYSLLPQSLDPVLEPWFMGNLASADTASPAVEVVPGFTPSIGSARAFNFLEGFTIHASGGGIWVSVNHGLSWFRPRTAVPRYNTDFSDPDICPPRYSAYAISVEPGSGAVFVGTDCGVAISRNRGMTWQHEEVAGLNHGEPIVAIAALGNSRVLAGANQGLFWSRNGGSSWTEDMTPGLRVSGLHAIGDLPVGNRALVVDNSTNLYSVDVQNSGLDISPVGNVPTAAGACGGIAQAQGYFGEVGDDGRRQGQLYIFYGNRCSPYAAKARVFPGGIVFPTSPDGWVKLDQNHVDFRHLLPRLVYEDSSASGGTGLPTISGFTEPYIADGGALENNENPDSADYVSMIANDGGLDIYDSSNTPVSVGSGPNKINALQLYQVNGQRVGAGGLHLYIGTQDNKVRASLDGGQSWPNADGGEGFAIDLEESVSSSSDTRVTYMECGACMTSIADAGFENDEDWDDPFVDTEGDAGYPLLMGDNKRISYGIDDKGTDEDADDTTHFYRRTGESGTWLKVTDAITSPVRDSVQISADGPSLPNVVFALRGPNIELPYYDGSAFSRSAVLGVVPDASNDRNITTAYPAMNGFGGLDRVGFQFRWAIEYGLDPADPNHLMAADILNRTVSESYDLGENWSPLPGLTELVTQNGDFFFTDASHTGNRHFPLVTAISYNPQDPRLIMLGTRQSGIYLSGNSGRTWKQVVNSGQIPNVTSFYWASTNRVFASSYGRGLWSIAISRNLVFPGEVHENWTNRIAIRCTRETPCRLIDLMNDRVRELADLKNLLFDDAALVYGGTLSQLGLKDGQIQSLAVSPGAGTMVMRNRSFVGRGHKDSWPITEESAATGFEFLPGKLRKEIEGSNIIAVLRQNGVVSSLLTSDLPLEWPEQTTKRPNLATELGSKPPMEGIAHMEVRVVMREVKGRSGYPQLVVTGHHLDPGTEITIEVDNGSETTTSLYVAGKGGRIDTEIRLAQNLHGQVLVTMKANGEVIDSELVRMPHIDTDEKD